MDDSDYNTGYKILKDSMLVCVGTIVGIICWTTAFYNPILIVTIIALLMAVLEAKRRRFAIDVLIFVLSCGVFCPITSFYVTIGVPIGLTHIAVGKIVCGVKRLM